jgi:hypothetical protein
MYRLTTLDQDVDMSPTKETITENNKILAKESLGYYELKQHKSWFDEECSKVLQ